MLKKILFFGVAIILGFIIASVNYMSNRVNHIFKLVETARDEKKYDEVVKVFTPYYDKTPVYSVTLENDFVIQIYAVCALSEKTTGEGDSAKTVTTFANNYAVYMFDFSSIEKEGVVTDQSKGEENGMKLVLGNDTAQYSYDFVNTEASRNLISTINNFNLVQIEISQAEIEKELNGQITYFEFFDAKSNSVKRDSLNLNFSEEFFTSSTELIINYDAYLEDNDKAEEWKKFYTKWQEDYQFNVGYTTKEVSPSSLIWKTVGVMAIYVVVVAVLGFLLFRRKRGRI